MQPQRWRPGHAAPSSGRRPWYVAVTILAIVAVIVVAVRYTPIGPTHSVSDAGATAGPSASPTAVPTGLAAPTATPSVSLSPSPSPRPTLSHPPAPRPTAQPSSPPAGPAPSATPVHARRKGAGVWSFSGVDTALAQSGAGWYYTWSTGHAGIDTPRGTNFVPMIWGPGSVTDDNLLAARRAGRVVLGFNEPDLASQSNMTVEQALDLWPKLMATGRVLGSPAFASGAATPGGWLDQFMSGAASRGYRVNFIALHWYGGDFRTANAVDGLRSYLQAVYDRYHKPIWLTEFALIDFSGGTRYPSEDAQAAFLTAATAMLDGMRFVKRYAWFALPAADSGPSSGLYRSGPAVTTVGRAFQVAR
jgi:Glycosyl hydrolase catalytic core